MTTVLIGGLIGNFKSLIDNSRSLLDALMRILRYSFRVMYTNEKMISCFEKDQNQLLLFALSSIKILKMPSGLGPKRFKVNLY